MPITNISIENFKGIGKRVDIPIRPITLLFGANSAGKSTILQALLYLRHVLENREPIKVNADKLEVSGESIDLGGFSQFVHNQDTSKEVIIGVTVTVDDDGLKGYCNLYNENLYVPINNVNEVSIRVGLKKVPESTESNIFVSRYEVDFDSNNIASIKSDSSLTEVNLKINEKHPIFINEPSFNDLPGNLNYRIEDGEEDLPDRFFPVLDLYEDFKSNQKQDYFSLPRKTLCIPKLYSSIFESVFKDFSGQETDKEEEAIYQLNQILVGSIEKVYENLINIRHLFGIRKLPNRTFKPKISNSNSRWSNGLAAWDILHCKEEEMLRPTLKALNNLGLNCSFGIEEYYKIPRYSSLIGLIPFSSDKGEYYIDNDDLKKMEGELNSAEIVREINLTDGSTSLNINDMGLGVSQVLPIVVGAYDGAFNIMSVEQPELHIHPAIQCKLADVLAHAVLGKKKADEKYLLLETHSEHLMLRLLRRIREKHEQELPPGAPEIDPEDISVIYVEKEDAGVKITHLPITEDGDFEKKWPKGFFEERTEELF
jgi:hypothetical protein